MSKKGGNWCSATGCRNDSKTTNRSFYKFPKDPARWSIWVNSCGRLDLLEKGPVYASKNCRLCSDHFEEKMFLNDLKTRLLPTAVPTLQMHGLMDIDVTGTFAMKTEATSSSTVPSVIPPYEQADASQISDLPIKHTLTNSLDALVCQISSQSIGIQTPSSMSSNPPRKRRLESKLEMERIKVAQFKDQTKEQHSDAVSEMTLADFQKACEIFLPPMFANLVKEQARVHTMDMNRNRNRNGMDDILFIQICHE